MAEPRIFSILDIEGFSASQPYAEGHVVTAAEAKALNQLRKENLSNNFRSVVAAYKEGVETGQFAEGVPTTEADLLNAFAALDNDYQFTLASVSAARKLDPVERKARTLARTIVKDNLAEQGYKMTEPAEGYTDDEWKDFIEEQIDAVAQMEEVVASAKASVKAEQKSAGLKLEGLVAKRAAA